MNKSSRVDSERWIMSFYRLSEISGAEFFARLARYLPAGPLQMNMTKHFADESQHAWLWSKALNDMGYKAERLKNTYQDAYLEAAGLPVNMMEILAITHVFEKRAANMYTLHMRHNAIAEPVEQTIKTILVDEGWHIKWVADELKNMEDKFGAENIQGTLKRYQKADEEVYKKAVAEYEDRMNFLIKG